MAVAFGVIGSLLGVICGAFLTRWIDFHYERRREIRQAITSALILRAELQDAKNGLDVFIENKHTHSGFLFHGLEAWEQHRESLLSAGMAHGDWLELASIFRHLLELAPRLREEVPELPDHKVEVLEAASADCKSAMQILDPFAAEGRISFFAPESVFEKPT